MNLIKKLKAFFTHNNEPVELDLAAAEIKNGKAFLHPKDQENLTYMVRSDDIEIYLSRGRSLTQDDIMKFEPKKKGDPDKTPSPNDSKKTGKRNRSGTSGKEESETSADEFDRYKKRKLVVSLYPEEYDMVVSTAKEYGYKRADFLLACVNSASKGTMERAHKKIVKSHLDIKKAQQTQAVQKTIAQ